jgi:hypothetical protein
MTDSKWRLVDRRTFREPNPFVVMVLKENGDATNWKERFTTAKQAIRRAEALVEQGERVEVFHEIKFSVK